MNVIKITAQDCWIHLSGNNTEQQNLLTERIYFDILVFPQNWRAKQGVIGVR